LTGLATAIEIGPDLQRLALKCLLGTATLLPGAGADEREAGRARLMAESYVPGDEVMVYLKGADRLTALREPLCHVAYVERSNGLVHGVVQFFGAIAIYCRLGTTDGPTDALKLTLDPITVDEACEAVQPLRLEPPPSRYEASEFAQLVNAAMMGLQDQAQK
jgi:hypothetical protein